MVRKWRRACFVSRVAMGVVVARLSAHHLASRIFSLLGIIVKTKEIRGEGVALIDIDAKRRTFLKYALFGGAVFVAGKYVNPIVNMLRGDTILSEKTFESFRITETGRALRVMDDEGSELLVIDKEGF